ncbi:MAG TPA: arginine N-succinyltransferase [Acidimicrobiales bacterium]|nr:arginine N-succinyltransferase [Acidimicrobiales bacterium]
MENFPTLVMRPSRPSDVDALVDMFRRAGEALKGVSTLRSDRSMIAARVQRSVESLETAVSTPGEENYWFVLTEIDSGDVIGTSGIFASVGLSDAFYSYRVGTNVHASREMGVYRRFATLYLSNDYTGTSEVGSLYVDFERRGRHAGKLASLSRFLFMAAHPERFTEKVIAEMRGYQDPDGRVPFWEGLGRHFFGVPFSQADKEMAKGNKSFIAELMPRHPIYVPLLPPDAQEVLGKVHADTLPARRMLEREGFRYQGYVDIFDGGPTLEARTFDLRAMRESRTVPVRKVDTMSDGPDIIVANDRTAGFRAIAVATHPADDGLLPLTEKACRALEVDEGDTVRWLPFNAPKVPIDV